MNRLMKPIVMIVAVLSMQCMAGPKVQDQAKDSAKKFHTKPFTSPLSSLPLSLEFIGEETIPTGYQFSGTEVGGLSGIDYDQTSNTYLVISDDRAQINAARFYELSIDLSDGLLNTGDIKFLNVTEILNKQQQPFAPASVDPESIRLSSFPDLLYWTSEGDANQGQPPAVRIMNRQGQYVDEFSIPKHYAPESDQGIRNNLAFESLTFSHHSRHLYTATEGALVQDGEDATLEQGSLCRVLKLSGNTGKALMEFVYQTDPVVEAPSPSHAFKTNGLVELLSISRWHFIAVERSFSVGKGNNIRLYLTTTLGATPIKNEPSIQGKDIRPMPKRLLLDLDQLGITLDNIEGITFGPTLENGEKTFILVSDNNFNAEGQFTQFLAFKVSGLK